MNLEHSLTMRESLMYLRKRRAGGFFSMLSATALIWELGDRPPEPIGQGPSLGRGEFGIRSRWSGFESRL